MTKEEALEILHKGTIYNPLYLDALNMAIKSLEAERPKAKWKIRKLNACNEAYCSNCNNGLGAIWSGEVDIKDFLSNFKKSPQNAYCRYCGADMRESEVEE